MNYSWFSALIILSYVFIVPLELSLPPISLYLVYSPHISVYISNITSLKKLFLTSVNFKCPFSVLLWQFLTWFFQHVLLLFKMFCKFVALALLPELKDHPILPATHTLAIVLFYLEAPQNGCFLYRLIYLLSILSPCHIEEVLGYHLITLWQDRILEKKIYTAAEIITLPKFTTLYKSLYS